jgi:hypothetical protein
MLRHFALQRIQEEVMAKRSRQYPRDVDLEPVGLDQMGTTGAEEDLIRQWRENHPEARELPDLELR